MKPQKRAASRNVTARPRPLRDEIVDDSAEDGLSIEPEEMGQSFLRYATENRPTRSSAVPELHADGAPPSDGAPAGPHFSPDASIWENTVNEVIEHGGVEGLNEEFLPREAGESAEDEDGRQPTRGVAEVDLTASVIEEASLLDEESSVLGESIPKHPRTEDTGSARRRGAQGDDEGD